MAGDESLPLSEASLPLSDEVTPGGLRGGIDELSRSVAIDATHEYLGEFDVIVCPYVEFFRGVTGKGYPFVKSEEDKRIVTTLTL